MHNDINVEDVLDEFIMEEPLTHAVLRSYIDRYPNLALDLTDLYHEMALADSRTASGSVELELASIDAATAPDHTVVEAALNGEGLRALAREIGLPRDFVAAFRDRKVRFGSIPASVLAGLARELGVAVHGLVDYLRGPPRASAGFAFKADGKPGEGTVIDYDDFLQGLALTDKEEAALERLCRPDGHS